MTVRGQQNVECELGNVIFLSVIKIYAGNESADHNRGAVGHKGTNLYMCNFFILYSTVDDGCFTVGPKHVA